MNSLFDPITRRGMYLSDLRNRMMDRIQEYRSRGAEFTRRQLFADLGDHPEECQRVFHRLAAGGYVKHGPLNGRYRYNPTMQRKVAGF